MSTQTKKKETEVRFTTDSPPRRPPTAVFEVTFQLGDAGWKAVGSAPMTDLKSGAEELKEVLISVLKEVVGFIPSVVDRITAEYGTASVPLYRRVDGREMGEPESTA